MKLRANQFGISDRLDELISNLEEMETAKKKGLTVELSQAKFVTPLSILPLVAYANENDMTIVCTEKNTDVCNYLDTIGFQEGVEDFQKIKGYLPITRLNPEEEKNDVLEEYELELSSK